MALEPGELQTPRTVIDYMTTLVGRLNTVVSALEEADATAARLRHEADLAESMAFVRSEGSMELRRHEARVSASPAEESAIVAEALVRHLRRSIDALDTEIEVARSIGVAVRSELGSLPYGDT